ncbi:MAG: hypothetical protein WCF44_12540 [Candidatus Methylophosphatis roskildensis]|uniref:Uncharacterized protein n=1 Tax=Candidatus Methylophosphatis roskildensis TaxID=2899263 RepID=A0A9D7HMF1_9PROT|nr:hypothetical protein [Candidatus Methylophosphatis roskildensis]MBK7234648.1 hypothetical protein [Sterolibacteriaceae bacterium]
MSELERLEERVQNLSPEELKKFRAWFAEFDAMLWDEQIAADSKDGKLDKLVSEALAEHKAGKSRPL